MTGSQTSWIPEQTIEAFLLSLLTTFIKQSYFFIAAVTYIISLSVSALRNFRAPHIHVAM
jgi:hypothetical protein